MLEKNEKEILDVAINRGNINTKYRGLSTYTIVGGGLTYIFKDKKRIIDISRYSFKPGITLTLYDSSEFEKLDYILRKFDEEYDKSNLNSLTYLEFVSKYTADKFGTYKLKVDVVLM